MWRECHAWTCSPDASGKGEGEGGAGWSQRWWVAFASMRAECKPHLCARSLVRAAQAKEQHQTPAVRPPPTPPPTPSLCHPAEQSCMGNNLPDITSRGFSAWLLSSQLSHRSLDHPQSPRPAQERRLVVAHVEARLRRAGAVGPDGSQSAAEDQLWYVRSSASRHAQLIPVLTRETRRSTAPCELRRRPPPWRQRASSGQRALHIVFGRPRWRDLCLGSASGSPECAAP